VEERVGGARGSGKEGGSCQANLERFVVSSKVASVESEWQALFALDGVFLKFAAHVFWRGASVCRWLQAGGLQQGYHTAAA